MHRALRYIIYALLALAALKGMYHLLAQAWFFYEGFYSGDAKYYLTVGRAMLNGFALYTDTFDTKPPPIYLVSALSLWLTNGLALGNIINASMTLLLPVVIGLAAWKMSRSTMHTATAVLFGLCMTLYLGKQAEPWQVEWYGGFFGLVYVALLAAFPKRTDTLFIALLSTCLVLTIGWKEPFVLSVIAAALVLHTEPKLLTKRLLIPVSVTAAFGILALLILGIADGYFGTYLSSNIGHHVAGRSIPFVLRGIFVDLTAESLARFSYVFLAVVCLQLVTLPLYYKRKWVGVLIILLCIYLVTLAGNIRGYPAWNHMTVMAPFLGAAFFAWLRKSKDITALLVPVLLSLTLILVPLNEGFSAYAARIDELRASEKQQQEIAEKLDALLTACEVERYFFVEERPYMHFMRHSPLNFFVYVGSESIVYHHPLLIEKQLESFSQAQVVIAKGDTYEIRERPEEKLLSEMTFRYLANNFTITPRKCAEGLRVPNGYSVLYRKDPNDLKPFPYKMK